MPNYRAEDWEEVREELALRLEELDTCEELPTIDEFNQHLDRLTQVMLEVIDAKVPKAKPSLYQKHWWSKELSKKQREICRLTCKAYSRHFDHDDPVHCECKSLRKLYAMIIKIQKKHHWDGFLELVDERTVYCKVPAPGGYEPN